MPGYITLIKFTKQGLDKIREAPERAKQAKAIADKLGIKNVGIWVTMGEYDVVAINDAPDDQTMAAYMLGWASGGTSTTQTLRAFSEDEFAQIVAKLP
jgi:uncharacterized protein with GYD domain